MSSHFHAAGTVLTRDLTHFIYDASKDIMPQTNDKQLEMIILSQGKIFST